MPKTVFHVHREMKTGEQSGVLPELTLAWSEIQSLAPLQPIRSEADFARIQELTDTLANAIGDDENHPLSSLFELTMTLITQWEDEHVSIPTAPPREVLLYLLKENDLKQKDLEDIPSPALISDILAGRREISKRLAKALADRFHVDIAAFI
jgi:HTH-type transcriptional regulator/antitoxin HigA